MHDFFKHFFGFHEKKIKIVAPKKLLEKDKKRKYPRYSLFGNPYFVKKAIGSTNFAWLKLGDALTSKCRCAPVLLPVLPMSAIVSPCSTC